ncbi:MAG: integrase/recombinase XerD [Acidimicrobiaceae bacterium]|nr:integrase/recombinase XerD [Acidimicrobiaceae bacterium]
MARTSNRQGDEALQRSIAAGWLETLSTPNTRAAYRTDLETFARWCAKDGSVPIRAGASTLVAFQAARAAAGDSTSTVRRRWSALSSFYEFAVHNDATRTNPVLGAVRPRIPKGDPSSTVQLTAQAVDAYRTVAAALDPRLDALVALLVSDGLKIGEVLALDIEDVSGKPPKTTVTIRRRGVSKQVTLDAYTARAVRRCAGRRRGGPLFTSNRTTAEPRRLTRFGADHLIRQLTTNNEARVTANELRRFHITANHEAGTNIDSVRDQAGLADLRSVRRYVTRDNKAAEPKPSVGRRRNKPPAQR